MVKRQAPPVGRTTIQRPLGGTEKIYWLLDKLYSLNFAAYVELEGKLDPAWLADIGVSPTLAQPIEDD